MIFKDVIFLIADGNPDLSGESFSIDAKIEVPKELHVWAGAFKPASDKFVGWARNIRRIDSMFIADIYTHEELGALPVEVVRHLTPSVSGVINLRENSVLKDVKVTKLDLTPWNSDKRIKTLANYSFSVEGNLKKK
jgi:hypothetical protein